ncbi:hypothetical protein ID144_23685 [Pseudomonas sp. JM0905a]|uniref:hypothetical protein n=1 Tax=Pseudomonas sp. JM0905a TaxID=2772484 RepID=UPI0016857967|nr:hypothetical protein [Pseudomonas sp. JM0905a]MBD2840049.1 hypothetical protein [Pseudomonas sp. JM0905a]
MDMASINGLVQGLKLTKQLATAAFDAKVEAEAKAKIGEVLDKLGDVQDKLFDLRNDLYELQTERDELKKKLDVDDAWKLRADAYALTKTAGNAVVYVSKEEPIHYACPSCFNKKEIHPLQDNRTYRGMYRCTGCEANYPIMPHKSIEPPVPTANHWMK